MCNTIHQLVGPGHYAINYIYITVTIDNAILENANIILTFYLLLASYIRKATMA